MTASEIIEQFRLYAGDIALPYLWSDDELMNYLNEAEVEACRRGRLLKVSDLSLGETKATSTITLLNGTYGFINVLSVEGINIISNTVPFTTDLNTTAMLLSNEINNSQKFTSTYINNVVRIQPKDGFGSSYNNIVPTINAVGIGVSILMFNNGVDGVCRISLKPNVNQYNLSENILKIERYQLNSDKKKKINEIDYRAIDCQFPGWEDKLGKLEYVVVGLATNNINVYKTPQVKDFIKLTAFITPTSKMVRGSDKPTIKGDYHSKLINWMLYRAYYKQDSEVNNPDEAIKNLRIFEQYFGDAVDNTAKYEAFHNTHDYKHYDGNI